jgi:hypothetical protein
MASSLLMHGYVHDLWEELWDIIGSEDMMR